MAKYKIPKSPKSPGQFWLQLADADGETLENRRIFQTFGSAKRIAATLVQYHCHSVLIIHGSADPNDPPPNAILADFSREKVSDKHRRIA